MKYQLPYGEVTPVRSDQVLLILVRQLGADAVVELDINGQRQQFSSPGHRSGFVSVCLDGELCEQPGISIFSDYQDTSEGYVELTSHELTRRDADYEVAVALANAQALWYQGGRDQVMQAYELLLGVDGAACKISMLRDQLFWLRGQLAYQRFEFDEAKQCYLSLSNQWHQDPDLSMAYLWEMGTIALEQNEPAEAVDFLIKAFDVAERGMSEANWLIYDQTEIRLYLALALMRCGEANRALQHLTTGLHVAAQLPSRVLEGKLKNNLAGFYENYRATPLHEYADDFERAMTGYEEALVLLEHSDEIVTRVSTLANLGRMSFLAGEYMRSQRYFEEALRQNNRRHNEVLRGYIYSQLGALYQHLGEYDRARHYRRHAFEIRTEAGAHLLANKDRLGLGQLERIAGRIETAIEYHKAASAYFREVGKTNELVVALLEESADNMEGGRLDLAKPILDEALSRFDEVTIPSLRLSVKNMHARLLVQSGNVEAAIERIDEATKFLPEINDLSAAIETYQLAMQIYKGVDLERSISSGLAAIEHVESLRGQLELARLGPSFSSKSHELFCDLSVVYLTRFEANGDPAMLVEAVRTMERSRSVILMAQRQHAQLQADPAVREAQRKVNVLGEKRLSSIDGGTADKALLDAYYEQLETFGSLLTTKPMTTHGLKDPVSYVQKALGSGERMFYYLAAAQKSVLISITADRVELFPMPQLPVLEQLVADFLRCVSSADIDGDELISASQKLSLAIIPPEIESELFQDANLVIVPHGVLQRIPFAALMLRDGSYLIDRVVISYCYSIASLAEERVPTSADLDVAILADPIFTTEEASTGEQANYLSGNGKATDEKPDSADSMRGWADSLQRLPWTAEEANSIRRTFGESRCATFVGAEASKSNLLREDVKNAHVLHIASHGYFAAEASDIVGIVLSAADDDENGFVSLTDMIGNQFNNELVVVSGCDTGKGEHLDGEGYMSVSRGFLSQGAASVISTLWPVSDRASATLMKFFYQDLVISRQPANALAIAQVRLKQETRYKHPSYWAGYLFHTTNIRHQLMLEIDDVA